MKQQTERARLNRTNSPENRIRSRFNKLEPLPDRNRKHRLSLIAAALVAGLAIVPITSTVTAAQESRQESAAERKSAEMDQFMELFNRDIEANYGDALDAYAHWYKVPREAILASIFVESARNNFASFRKALGSVPEAFSFAKKHLMDSAAGRKFLEKMGHHTFLGAARDETTIDALIYGHGMSRKEASDFVANQLARIECIDPKDEAGRAKVANLVGIQLTAVILATHQRQWAKVGYDIYTSNFPGIETFPQRVGLHVTLYNVYGFSSRSSFPNPYPELGGSWIESLNTDFGHLAERYVAALGASAGKKTHTSP